MHALYGDESISYYQAHASKDLNSLLEDNVLPLLTRETTVMHDHNKVNYNALFCFQNIECNQQSLISLTIKERKDLIALNVGGFSEGYIKTFKREITVPSEPTLLGRIEEYYNNYFRWVEDFKLPTTDNLSERGLRSIKSHMKISGSLVCSFLSAVNSNKFFRIIT